LFGKEYGPGEQVHSLASALMVRGASLPSHVFMDQNWNVEKERVQVNIIDHQAGLINEESFIKQLNALTEHHKELQGKLADALTEQVSGIVGDHNFCDYIKGIVSTMPGEFQDLKGEYAGLPATMGMSGVDAWVAKLQFTGILGPGEIEYYSETGKMVTYCLIYANKKNYEKDAFLKVTETVKTCMSDIRIISWSVSENDFLARGNWSEGSQKFQVKILVDDSFYFGNCMQLIYIVE
jgi:hypothetical protein